MGSLVSPVVANLFMKHNEKIAINTSLSPIRFWRRCLDDTVCFLQKPAVNREKGQELGDKCL